MITENLTMGKRPESACGSGFDNNLYGAKMGSNVYESMYNTERSRLEFILFNTSREIGIRSSTFLTRAFLE